MFVCAMCVKLTFGDLNSNHYLSYSTNTYTCRITIALKIYSSINFNSRYMLTKLNGSLKPSYVVTT